MKKLLFLATIATLFNLNSFPSIKSEEILPIKHIHKAYDSSTDYMIPTPIGRCDYWMGEKSSVDATMFANYEVDNYNIFEDYSWQYGIGGPTGNFAIDFSDFEDVGLDDVIVTFAIKGESSLNFSGVKITDNDGNIEIVNFKKNNDWFYYQGYLNNKSFEFPFSVTKVEDDPYYFNMVYPGTNLPIDDYFVDDTIAPALTSRSSGLIIKNTVETYDDVKCFKINSSDLENVSSYLKKIVMFEDTFDKNVNVDITIENCVHKNIDYLANIEASDSAGNKTSRIYGLIINDDVSPIIEGPDVIYKGSQYLLTFDDIIDLFKISDDSELATKIYDGDTSGNKTYEGNGNVPGDYMVRLTAEDENGNLGIKPIEIKVYNELAPIMILDNTTIFVFNNIKLESSDFIQILKTTKLVNTNYENSYTILEDTYSDSYMSTGLHKLSILVKSSSGNSLTHTFEIKVLQSKADIFEESDHTWVNSVGDFFENIWLWIWDNVFKPVFKLFGYEDR